MARLKNGIFGVISGKLGPIVGGIWKGIPYLRERPKPGKSKTKRTAGQLANEAKFKFGNNWLVPFHPYVAIGFENLAIGKTAISAAFSANYLQVISGDSPNFMVDYGKVIISKGKLPQLANPLIQFASPELLEISWQPNTGKRTAYSDQLMLVLYSPVLKIADGFVGAAKRADEHCRFKINPQLVGEPLEAYLCMVSLDRKRVSDSRYMGRIEP